LGLTLPEPPSALGVYAPALVAGSLVYTAGHLPADAAGNTITGRLGETLTTGQGAKAARWACLSLLASVRAAVGTLDRIAHLVKLTGFVSAAPDFKDHSAVVNGASELLRDIFGGEVGVGTRSAVGVASLPKGAAVELEGVFALRE